MNLCKLASIGAMCIAALSTGMAQAKPATVKARLYIEHNGKFAGTNYATAKYIAPGTSQVLTLNKFVSRQGISGAYMSVRVSVAQDGRTCSYRVLDKRVDADWFKNAGDKVYRGVRNHTCLFIWKIVDA